MSSPHSNSPECLPCLCLALFPCVQFFGAVVTIAYGASALFSYLDWKGDGGNAANTTVPT